MSWTSGPSRRFGYRDISSHQKTSTDVHGSAALTFPRERWLETDKGRAELAGRTRSREWERERERDGRDHRNEGAKKRLRGWRRERSVYHGDFGVKEGVVQEKSEGERGGGAEGKGSREGSEMKRRVPISIEELKKRAEVVEREQRKPVFLSMEERRLQAVARLAEKRAKEKADRGRRMDGSENHKRKNFGAKELKGRAEVLPRESLRDFYLDKDATSRSKRKKKAVHMVVGGTLAGGAKPEFDWDEEDDTTQMNDPIVDGLDVINMSSVFFPRVRMAGMRDVNFSDGHVGNRSTSGKRDSRHWSEKALSEMTDRDWRIFREDHRITIRGGVFRLARNWEETGLPGEVLNAIPYPKPTAIQMAGIPVALAKKDTIGLAETGSGKTAAFVLPMLSYLIFRSKKPTKGRVRVGRYENEEYRGPYAIILAPTRELVNQIVEECERLMRVLDLRVVGIVGGVDIEAQGISLHKGCDVVVATPGRMMDVLDRRYVVLSSVGFVVLDEADRMVDMGFGPQVDRVLEGIGSRQMMMFSATMPQEVERIAREYMVKPVVIKIGDRGMAGQDVDQRVEYLHSIARKRLRLAELLNRVSGSVIVFANTKRTVDDIARYIEINTSRQTITLHSSKSQDQRIEGLEKFRSGRVSVLVATDVLGRGIDIKGVSHVINYEIPSEISKYTHRIGRTGRAGEKGTAWTLVTKEDEDVFGDLTSLLEQAGASVPREVRLASANALKNGFGRAIID